MRVLALALVALLACAAAVHAADIDGQRSHSDRATGEAQSGPSARAAEPHSARPALVLAACLSLLCAVLHPLTHRSALCCCSASRCDLRLCLGAPSLFPPLFLPSRADKDVVKLDSSNFDAEVKESAITLVEFFAPVSREAAAAAGLDWLTV